MTGQPPWGAITTGLPSVCDGASLYRSGPALSLSFFNSAFQVGAVGSLHKPAPTTMKEDSPATGESVFCSSSGEAGYRTLAAHAVIGVATLPPGEYCLQVLGRVHNGRTAAPAPVGASSWSCADTRTRSCSMT